jgi:3-oxoacyl-[acyl-carrier-protein] synthase II
VSRAVITGAGVVSALGIGREAFFDGLEAGRSGIAPIRRFDARTFPTKVAGEAPLPEASRDALRTDPRLRDRKVVLALSAANEAWAHAGAGPDEQVASLSIGLGLEEAFVEDFAGAMTDTAFDLTRSTPVPSFRARVDLAADAVRESLALEGRSVVHVSACASGALAVAHGAAWIERGLADVVLAGAADSMINPLGIGGMARLGAPSPRAASDACKPFDRARDGLAIGEGAAFFVLESAERAARRGARVLAAVLGFGSTQDAFHATAPRPDGSGAREAMTRALRRAGIAPRDVGYVNAHGTGTRLNDVTEAIAIETLFGQVPVSSIKGAIGHAMAAAGALELAACLMAFERDLLPGTANHDERDEACPIHVIGRDARPARASIVLSNSFGFGGQNASVILGRAAS